MTQISADKILSQLPQTQCQKCGFASCRDYAEAIAKGTPINRCPTGGEKGIRRLARITGKSYLPLNTQYGLPRPRVMAVIDEAACIGCRLCLQACPVDAIIGAQGFIHTVLPQQCTGCDLCLPTCPVDCITTINTSGNRTGWDAWSSSQAQQAGKYFLLREERLKQEERARQRQKTPAKKKAGSKKKKDAVSAAMEKARLKAAQKKPE